MTENSNLITGLSIIGESINDSVPSTKELLDKNDINGLQKLAVFQSERGASYLDVNIGRRDPSFIAELVPALQEVTSTPLCLDSPNIEILKHGLNAYKAEKANGFKPIINSISELRIEVLELLKIQPFKLILLSSERKEGESSAPNLSAEDIYKSAKYLYKKACSPPYCMHKDDLIIDPGIAPLATDFEGATQRTIFSMALISTDSELKGTSMSVGLSNFSIMLPAKRKSGGLVKTPLENAFITMAMPLGLNMIIGSVKKKYQLLSEDDEALKTLKDFLAIGDYEAIERLQKFYNS